jgi:hypothetical protein
MKHNLSWNKWEQPSSVELLRQTRKARELFQGASEKLISCDDHASANAFTRTSRRLELADFFRKRSVQIRHDSLADTLVQSQGRDATGI